MSQTPIPSAHDWSLFYHSDESPEGFFRRFFTRKPRMDFSSMVLAGQWELLAKIGEGGMAEVYRAWSRITRKNAALKLHKSTDKEGLIRFEREFFVLHRFSHPHLVKADSFYPAQGGEPCFYSMEHLEGISLEERTRLPLFGDRNERGHGPLLEEHALHIALQVADVIAALHDAGIIHRDIKPGNIIVSQRNGRDHATLVDLGACKWTPRFYATLDHRTPPEQRLITKSGYQLGTPGFMGTSEGADGEQRDVFGLSATLFKIVLGRFPYPAGDPKPGEVLNWQDGDDTRLSASLQSVLEKGLQGDPEARYPSIQELRDALLLVAEELALERAESGDDVPGNEFCDDPQTFETLRRKLAHAAIAIGQAPSAPQAPAPAIANLPTEAPTPRRRKILVAVAASISVTMGFSWFLWGSPPTPLTGTAFEPTAKMIAVAPSNPAPHDFEVPATPAADVHPEADPHQHVPAIPAANQDLRGHSATRATHQTKKKWPRIPLRKALKTASGALTRCSDLADGLLIVEFTAVPDRDRFSKVEPVGESSQELLRCVRQATAKIRFTPVHTDMTFMKDYHR